MDIRLHGVHSYPERLSPRRLSHMHGLMMASVRRDLAMRAQAMSLACGVGFNGDKKGFFRNYINRMMSRVVFRKISEPEPYQNISSFEDAKAAALAHAQNFANGNGDTN